MAKPLLPQSFDIGSFQHAFLTTLIYSFQIVSSFGLCLFTSHQHLSHNITMSFNKMVRSLKKAVSRDNDKPGEFLSSTKDHGVSVVLPLTSMSMP